MVAQLQEELMSTLTLRGILTDILNNTDLTDVHEIMQEILKRIPKARYHEVLEVLLIDYVRHYLGTTRTRSNMPPASAFPKIVNSKHAGGIKSTTTSTKVAAIRDGWQQHLRDRISIGQGDYKFLKDCTYDDLMHAAKQREKLAEANKAWAARFHGYAALLTEYDVKTFGELPIEVHLKVLGTAA
jgi:hypothetical protein